MPLLIGLMAIAAQEARYAEVAMPLLACPAGREAADRDLLKTRPAPFIECSSERRSGAPYAPAAHSPAAQHRRLV